MLFPKYLQRTKYIKTQNHKMYNTDNVIFMKPKLKVILDKKNNVIFVLKKQILVYGFNIFGSNCFITISFADY